MKYANLKAFEKHLESAAPNHLSDVYLVMSKEDFERRSACEKIADQVLSKKIKVGENFYSFDAGEVDAAIIWEELQSFSFLSSKRVITILQAEKIAKPMQDQLRSYFSKPNTSICLILETSTLNRATGFYKDAEKCGVVLDLPEEKPWEKEKALHGWVIEKIKSEGKEVDPGTALALVKQLGTDQSMLYQEVEKLVCYVGDRKQITTADVAAVCIKVPQENGWQLGEAIFRRDGSAALRITRNMLDDGVALIALLRQIRTQFQTDFQVCCLLANGKTPQDVASQFPYMKGNILSKHIQQAQVYGMQRFRAGLLAIDETELLAKNSAGEPDWLAERLIFTLVTK